MASPLPPFTWHHGKVVILILHPVLESNSGQWDVAIEPFLLEQTDDRLYVIARGEFFFQFLDKLDILKKRGIRQISKLDTTWAQLKLGENATNEDLLVYDTAARVLNPSLEQQS